ncbi:hypothetical protein HanXRQr2_Chr08g0329851 [Helianthus annuus]|uniref:Uncharacterized protein n=1 Tax=Helianthus annuus TaxID=4232 RepID=A0A9K3ID68_HELAN|nr:hypothetical protein HanXRQr2_Chr08g0329851 [Helianthus annuus]KAJ0532593.1 hypothetical protein HanIR_Chr09g0398681 [Helianthus annuus]
MYRVNRSVFSGDITYRRSSVFSGDITYRRSSIQRVSVRVVMVETAVKGW